MLSTTDHAVCTCGPSAPPRVLSFFYHCEDGSICSKDLFVFALVAAKMQSFAPTTRFSHRHVPSQHVSTDLEACGRMEPDATHNRMST